MPIIDAAEAKDLDREIERLLAATTDADRQSRLRTIFVDKLDFSQAQGQVDLRADNAPVASGARIAQAEGVQVVWASLPSDKIRVTDSRSISKALSNQLGDDHLIVVSNADASVWQFIYPAQT